MLEDRKDPTLRRLDDKSCRKFDDGGGFAIRALSRRHQFQPFHMADPLKTSNLKHGSLYMFTFGGRSR